jgi:hypothetical protein
MLRAPQEGEVEVEGDGKSLILKKEEVVLGMLCLILQAFESRGPRREVYAVEEGPED